MFEQRKRLFIAGAFLFDAAVFTIGAWVCIWLMPRFLPLARGPAGSALYALSSLGLLAVVWAYILWSLGFYDRVLLCQFSGTAADLPPLALSMSCLLTLVFMLGSWNVSRCVLVFIGVAGWGGGYHFGFGRYLRNRVVAYLWRRGLRSRVVVAGLADDVGRALGVIERHSALLEAVGLVICGEETAETATASLSANDLPVEVHAHRLPELVVRRRGGTVVVAGTLGNRLASAVAQCRELGVDSWCMRANEAVAGGQVPLELEDLDVTGRGPVALMLKEGLDVIASSLLLLLSSPLLLMVGALVRITSPGPALFRQERDGRYGVPFVVCKFRTMQAGKGPKDCPSPVVATPNILSKPRTDPRVTRLGHFLRRSSLDELPQLWNVLQGDMSLVGPRPMLASETALLPQLSDRRRLRMKPGMTGLWQVSGRSNIHSMRERVDLDLRYVDQWSIALDICILLRTIPAVCTARGAQ